jgi:hypothetical protein
MHGASTFAEDRRRQAGEARILFSAALDPTVLLVEAEPASDAEADFDLARFDGSACVCVDGEGREHVILSDGFSHLRLDVRSGTVLAGPVRFRLVIDRLHVVSHAVRALDRLAESVRIGRLVARPLLTPERALRWQAALIAWDARGEGASQREIAALLVGIDRVREEWGGVSDSLRARVRRLLDHGEAMVSGGWRTLLATGD